MHMIEARRYSQDSTSDITQASYPSVASAYDLGATDPFSAVRAISGAMVEEFGEGPDSPDRPHRCNLFPVVVDASPDGKTVYESIYLAFVGEIRGASSTARKILLQNIGELSVTGGAEAVAGGRSDHAWAKTVSFSSTGVLEALTGGLVAPAVFPSGTVASGIAGQAGLCLYDVANARAVVRVLKKGTAAGAASMIARWR